MIQSSANPTEIHPKLLIQLKKLAISGKTQKRATPTKSPPLNATKRRDQTCMELNQTPQTALRAAMAVMTNGRDRCRMVSGILRAVRSLRLDPLGWMLHCNV